MILADIYKRLDQQGTLLVQIADRIIAASERRLSTTGSVPVSIMGIPLGDIKDIIGMVRRLSASRRAPAASCSASTSGPRE